MRRVVTPLVAGLEAAPEWFGNSVTVSFARGARRKIVHVQGFDATGQELKLVSVGGLTRPEHPDAGRHSYRFENSGRALARVKIFAAPRFVTRVFPYELRPPGAKVAEPVAVRSPVSRASTATTQASPQRVEVTPAVSAAPAKTSAFAKDELAEIAVFSDSKVNVGELRKGSRRLNGNSSKFTWVAKELVGRDFLRVGWKASPKFRIVVTEPGYLYVIRASDEFRAATGLDWTETQKWIMGPYVWGIYRTPLQAGQKLDWSGRELSVVADKIHLHAPE